MKEEGKNEREPSVQVEIETGRQLLYTVNEIPPWYLCLLLGFQQFMAALGSIIPYSIVIAPYLCLATDTVGLSEHIGTVIFVAGISTLLQTSFGVRLPTMQGISLSFVNPVITLLTLPQWTCPYADITVNRTSLPEVGSPEHRDIWYSRLAELQGAVMVASLFPIVIGFSGMVGLLLNFIGPLTITPTIAMIGFSLFDVTSSKASGHWWIAIATVILIVIFSQYLRSVGIPCLTYSRGKCTTTRFLIFNLFPILLAVILTWLLCVILTVTGALTDDPEGWGYNARTDIRTDVLQKAQWFRFPYPGQWGMPTVSVPGVVGMLCGNLASMVASVGTYYAYARVSGAPPPPRSAVSRGIGMEGVTCLLAGAWGAGAGTISYSSNIGVVGITKVGSRIVMQVAALIMIVLGCLGKFGALFVSIPDPVIGGMLIVIAGMLAAVGISNLHFVDLRSMRNLFILGISLFIGLRIPRWISENPQKIRTGNATADQIVTVLCGTSMFIAGAVAALLDNTIPGTDEERGIIKWRQHDDFFSGDERTDTMATYDLPLIQKYLNEFKCTKYVPFCPNFDLDGRRTTERCICCQRSTNKHAGADNPAYNSESADTRM